MLYGESKRRSGRHYSAVSSSSWPDAGGRLSTGSVTWRLVHIRAWPSVVLRTLDVISVGSVVRLANVGVTVLHVAITIVVASRAAGGTLLVAVTSVIAVTAVKVAVALTIARTIARGWAIAIPRTIPDRAAAAVSVAAATRRSLSPPAWWCTPGCFTTVEAPVG